MSRAAAFLLTLLVLAAAATVTAAPAAAQTPCWKQVLNDWSKDDRIDGRYSARCIEEAIAKMPEDIRAYSDFAEQARAAMDAGSRTLYSARGARGGDGGAGPGGGGGGGAGAGGVQEVEPATGRDEGPIAELLAAGGPNNADSVPLPLLILAALAAMLVLGGIAGLVQRKLRADRVRTRP